MMYPGEVQDSPGVHPMVLLLRLLEHKGVLNRNEISWVMNSQLMSINQIALSLSKDDGESSMMMESISAIDFWAARKKALDRYRHNVCGGEIDDYHPETKEAYATAIQADTIFKCLKCGEAIGIIDLNLNEEERNKLEKANAERPESGQPEANTSVLTGDSPSSEGGPGPSAPLPERPAPSSAESETGSIPDIDVG